MALSNEYLLLAYKTHDHIHEMKTNKLLSFIARLAFFFCNSRTSRLGLRKIVLVAFNRVRIVAVLYGPLLLPKFSLRQSGLCNLYLFVNYDFFVQILIY